MAQLFILGMGVFGLSLILIGIAVGIQSNKERKWYQEPDVVERALRRPKLRVVRAKKGK